MSRQLPPLAEGRVALPDGRKLGYAEYGDTAGKGVFWFHGTPGGRGQVPFDAREFAAERGVRLVAVERPGIGHSTAHLYDSFVDWARDIEVLADTIGIDAFGVVGLSGGGPYALACAHHMPQRVVAAGVLGGVAPVRGKDAAKGGVVSLTPYAGPLLRRVRRPLGALLSQAVQTLEPVADHVHKLYMLSAPPGDRRLFEDPHTRRMFQQDLINGTKRGGFQSVVLDLVLFGRPWGFSLRDVKVPVFLWFGDADNIIPLKHAKHMAGLLPNATLRVRPQEGHLGGLGCTTEVFETLLANW